MSQWLLKKRNKKRSKSISPRKTISDVKSSDVEFREYLSRRQKSSSLRHITLNSQQKQNSGDISNSKDEDLLGSECRMKVNIKDDSIYSEPWDVNCQSLNNGGMCCACMTNRIGHCKQEKDTTTHDTRMQKINKYHKSKSKSENKTMIANECKQKTAHKVRLHIEHTEESDTGCEISDSSDESDCYEFLENIERRLKIDYSKCNPVIMPRWDSDITQKDRECQRNKHHLKNNGYNAKCVDEILYTCGSDHSSGFHEMFNPPKNNKTEKKISTDIPELFAFPLKESHIQRTCEQQNTPSFTSSNVYRTGYGCKGNRLLGDLIQLNYEKQQLQ